MEAPATARGRGRMSLQTFNTSSFDVLVEAFPIAATSANRRRGADANASSGGQPQEAGVAGLSPRVTGRNHPFTAPPRAQRGISEVCTLYTGGGRQWLGANAPRRRTSTASTASRRRARSARWTRRAPRLLRERSRRCDDHDHSANGMWLGTPCRSRRAGGDLRLRAFHSSLRA